jgi:hypothetical protein
MKKIKLIFLAITFFTLSVAHSQTDEVKRNLYEQEKIRIEKLEKDAQYSGDDEFVRKRMNLPPKLPSFEQWVLQAEPPKVDIPKEVETNAQQQEVQKIIVEENTKSNANDDKTSKPPHTPFTPFSYFVYSIIPVLYLILNFIFYSKNKITKKLLLRPPFSIGNKTDVDDVAGAATKNNRMMYEFGALCAWGFVAFLPFFAGGMQTNSTIEIVLESGLLTVGGHLLYIPALMGLAYMSKCPKCNEYYAKKVVNTFDEAKQNYRTSRTNNGGQTFYTDHEVGVHHTDNICLVCSHQWRISKSYHKQGTGH